MESDIACHEISTSRSRQARGEKIPGAPQVLRKSEGLPLSHLPQKSRERKTSPRHGISSQIGNESAQIKVLVGNSKVMSESYPKQMVLKQRTRPHNTAASQPQTKSARISNEPTKDRTSSHSAKGKSTSRGRSVSPLEKKESVQSAESSELQVPKGTNLAGTRKVAPEQSSSPQHSPHQTPLRRRNGSRRSSSTQPSQGRLNLENRLPSALKPKTLVKPHVSERSIATFTGADRGVLPPGARTRKSSLHSPPDLGWYEEVNLKEFFPSEKRDTWSRILTPVVFTIFAWAVFLSCYGLSGIFFARDPIQALLALTARGALIWSMVAYVYTTYYRRTTRYHVSGFRLTVSRGVFKRYKASILLSGGVQVYVSRTVRDALFGLYRIKIIAPLSPNNKVTEFRGYTKQMAYAMHDWITDQCNRQVFISGDAKKAEQFREEERLLEQ